MNQQEHTSGLGEIIGNLHALEMVLRVFLSEAHDENTELPKAGAKTVPETYLTNFLSLGQLIELYNDSLTSDERSYAIDTAVVDVRDAIAHGRLLSPTRGYPLTLYKFGKPTNKVAPVERVDVISEGWVKEKRELVYQQVGKVAGCSKTRGYKNIG
jgi:hypothetical protein